MALLSLLFLLAAEFTNPLLPRGADPWVIHKDGWYYYTHTTGRNVTLWRTRDLKQLATAESRVIWTPPASGPYSKEIWAPELHHLDGKWYVYFAADDGQNRNHRLFVLECASKDPIACNWQWKAKLETPGNKWSIDGTIFKHRGRHYLLWSGWEGDENGRQDIYIARMTNPWTVQAPRVRISTPELPWERHGTIPKPGPDDKPEVYVNEGPQPLVRNGRVYVVYSASGCWTDEYALGMIYADAKADLLDPGSWRKHPEPVFKSGPSTPGTYAAGHNSFFRDGKRDYILYHANPEPSQGCGAKRSPRAQPFTWTPAGFPDFGKPAPLTAPAKSTGQAAGGTR